jgi:uncharacterized membrane protein YgcG
MTRARRLLLVGAALWAAAQPGGAAAERIRDFQSEVRLDRDGSFEVAERIVYDFGSEQRHGITRDIPVRYGRGAAADYRIDLEVESVTDARGAARAYDLSRQGPDRRIRIGSPSRTVTGVQEYRIRYRVRRGLLWFRDHDELYWNVTGSEWKVPIDAAAVRVELPGGEDRGVRFVCFTGRLGSSETACGGETEQGAVAVAAERQLAAGEGLTVAVWLPKGLIPEPSAAQRALERAGDSVTWAALLPVAVVLGLTAVWWRRGRDPAGAVAIPVRYEPPEGMTPAEMGTVLDERADLVDVTATILDLAVRGYLRIEETEAKKFFFLSETGYTLHRSDRSDADLKAHEKKILAGLFGGRSSVDLAELRNQFYTRLPGIKEALYDEVSRQGGWFPARPDRVRARWAAGALVPALPAAGAAFVLGDTPLLLSILVSAALALLFGRAMPRRTLSGRRARQHIQGFKEFVERVETDRLERLGLRSVSQFEKLLPYAFVLGAADAWAEAFADLYTQPPDWYVARGSGSFQPRQFVSRVGRSLDTVGQVMRSTPSRGSGSSGFGGGGFSGGGFGGGGGGSW